MLEIWEVATKFVTPVVFISVRTLALQALQMEAEYKYPTGL